MATPSPFEFFCHPCSFQMSPFFFLFLSIIMLCRYARSTVATSKAGESRANTFFNLSNYLTLEKSVGIQFR